jgi:hypothetical protein
MTVIPALAAKSNYMHQGSQIPSSGVPIQCSGVIIPMEMCDFLVSYTMWWIQYTMQQGVILTHYTV